MKSYPSVEALLEEAKPLIAEFAKLVEADQRTAKAAFARMAEELFSLKRDVPDTPPRSWFNREFAQLLAGFVAATGLPEHRQRSEYGKHLSALLGYPVQPLRVKEWSRRIQPRTKELATQVITAATKITEQALAGELGYQEPMVPPDEVKKAMDAWIDMGLDRRQLRIAGELTPFTVGVWCRGQASAPRPQFERAQEKIRMWYALMGKEGALTSIPREEFVNAYIKARELGFADSDILQAMNMAPFRLRCLLGKAESKTPAFLTEKQFKKFKHVFLPEQ